MQQTQTITFVIFLIFSGTAILSTLALYTRQSLLVAYIAIGVLLGPWGFKLVTNSVVMAAVLLRRALLGCNHSGGVGLRA
jgi:Kef-type K+ transport system membrane component KefB